MKYFVIPARKGSKRFPDKNKKLFKYTADTIKFSDPKKVIVTTDDMSIINMALEKGFDIIHRHERLCTDTASMKDVLIDVIKKKKLKRNDSIMLLYLTYPERTEDDVILIDYLFTVSKTKSMLCKMKVTSHPFMMMYNLSGNRGHQVVRHNMYRAQDYPKVFEISHFIGIFKVSEVKNLNKNLYNDRTIFQLIGRKIDIDTLEDYENFLKQTWIEEGE